MTLPHITICDCVSERERKPHVTIPRAQYEALMGAVEPFAWIGQWMFARDLPDDTPVVTIHHLNGRTTSLTRGQFKAAHAALRSAGIEETR